MNEIAVVSAMYGGYDDIYLESGNGFDGFVFTDSNIRSSKVNIINTPYHLYDTNDIGERNSLSKNRNGQTYNMMAAKYYKINHHKIPDLSNYKYTIWLDSSFAVNNKDFSSICINELAESAISVYRHAWRGCIKDEAIVSSDFNDAYIKKRYENQPVLLQYEKYVNDGFNDNYGLYNCGLIVRRIQKETNFFMDLWWREIQKYSFQDQISFPYVMWLNKLSIGAISGSIYDGRLASFMGHK